MKTTVELPTPGDIVADKYRVDAILGEGGMARVFRATDLSIGRGVALKVLKPSDDPGARREERFLREAQQVGRLQDPHTIRMFDSGRTEDGLLFLVFELVAGRDLGSLRTERGTLTPPEVEHIMRQLLMSLREAHRSNVLHRDIKPDNILVYEYMGDPLRVKLMDFGIAIELGEDRVRLTQTGRVVGTLTYMAPEQLTNATLTPATDLWAVGLVMVELLSGQRREARAGTLDLESLAGSPLGPVLRRLLAANAADRLQSVEEVLHALDHGLPAAAPHVPRAAPPVPAPPFTAPPEVPPARFKMAALMGGSLAVLVIAAIAVAMWPTDEPHQVEAPARRTLSTIVSGNVADTEPVPAAPAKAADAGSPCRVPDWVGWPHYVGDQKTQVFAPKSLAPGIAHPLLIIVHTDDDTASKMAKYVNAMQFAEEHQVVLMLPNGASLVPPLPYPKGWTYNSNLVPIRQAVDELRDSICIDESRIWVLGHASGGVTAERLSCEPWVTAVATTSFRTYADRFACASPPIPSLHFYPTRSKHLPAEGGPNKDCLGHPTIMSIDAQEEAWRTRNECSESSTRTKQQNATCTAWNDCAAPFVSCHVDGGHGWPGMESPRPIDVSKCDGPNADYPYLDEIWRFFSSLDPPEKPPR